jgi:hypothetical protein
MIRGSKNTMSCTECILVSNMYLIISTYSCLEIVVILCIVYWRQGNVPSRAIVKTLPIASAKRPKDLNDDSNAT